MRVKIIQAVIVMVLPVIATPGTTYAIDAVEESRTVEVDLSDGLPLRIENLLGSVQVKRSSQTGTAQVTARVVAEAKPREEAAALAAGVELRQETGPAGIVIHVGFPVDAADSFRTPKAGFKGLVSKWSGALLRKSATTIDYGGREVTITKDRKAAGLAVHLTVAVPLDTPLTIRQGIGSVEVGHWRGDLQVETDDGNVEVVHCYGTFRINTAGANVQVVSFQGDALDLATGDGGIEMEGIRVKDLALSSTAGRIGGTGINAGTLGIRNGSGAVKMVDIVPKILDVTTISGNIDLAIRLRSAEQIAISSETGDLVLRLGKYSSFDLLADFKSESPKTPGLDLELIERHGRLAHYRNGAGGVDLQVRTGTGKLMICNYDATRFEVLTGLKLTE
jgi:hypothetical protein